MVIFLLSNTSFTKKNQSDSVIYKTHKYHITGVLQATSGALGRLGNRISPAWPWPYLFLYGQCTKAL